VLGTIYDDEDFSELFKVRGRLASTLEVALGYGEALR
jgi:hypothetical protein